MTSPVARCLKEQFEGESEIHFLTKKSYTDLVKFNPNIDKVHFIENSHKEILDTLKSENYDYVIDLHNNIRTMRVKKALGVKSFSFHKLNIEKWMLVNFKKDNLPDVHIVTRYLDTLKEFNIQDDKKGLDFFFPEDYVFSENLYPVNQKFIAFVIGAKYNTKRLPEEEITKICEKQKLPVVLLGGPDEKLEGDRIANQFDHVSSLCGKCSLMDSAHIVKNAQLVICNDTGLMHIASAFQKNIVSIWGNTVPKFGMYPFNIENNYSIHEVEGLKCRPCSKIGYKECPKSHFNCMKQQDLNKIQDKIESFI